MEDLAITTSLNLILRVLLETISSSLREKKMLFTSLGQSVSGKNCTDILSSE